MNTVQRIAKNLMVLFSSQLIAYLLAFFYTIYIARYLGPVGFGILSFSMALVSIFGIFGDLGLSTLLTREVSRDKSLQDKYVGNFIPIKIVLSILTFSLLVLLVNLMGYSQQTVYIVYIFGLYMVTFTFSQIFFALFQAYEKMEYQAISLLINNLLILIGVIYGISLGFDIAYFAVLYFITSLIVLIYSFLISTWKFASPHIKIDLKFWKKSLRLALPLSIVAIFATISFRVDTVILEVLQGNISVGWYNAAYRLIDFLNVIPIVFTGAIFPVLSKFHVSSKESLKFMFEKSLKYLFIIGLPIAAATTILAQDIILLLYQNSYYQSIFALQILIWAVPFLFFTSVFGVLFVSINKPNILIKSTLIIMIFNIVTNLIFIPIYSYIAASIITVITEIIATMLLFYYISPFIKINLGNTIRSTFLKPIFASTIMSLFMLFVHVNFYLLIILATLIYLGLLLILKTFSKDDFEILKKII
jgi:O-antigen/teichoic acid export membrane protein